VLEALAAGAPSVISPAVNNAAEVEGAGAAIIAPAEPRAFAEAILSLLTDPVRAASLRGRARAFAAAHDWSVVGPRWVEAYAGVLAARRSVEAA